LDGRGVRRGGLKKGGENWDKRCKKVLFYQDKSAGINKKKESGEGKIGELSPERRVLHNWGRREKETPWEGVTRSKAKISKCEGEWRILAGQKKKKEKSEEKEPQLVSGKEESFLDKGGREKRCTGGGEARRE